MGFSKTVYLYCDGGTELCDYDQTEASVGDSQHDTIRTYKAAMLQEGWVFRGQKAYCPGCVDELRRKALKGGDK